MGDETVFSNADRSKWGVSVMHVAVIFLTENRSRVALASWALGAAVVPGIAGAAVGIGALHRGHQRGGSVWGRDRLANDSPNMRRDRHATPSSTTSLIFGGVKNHIGNGRGLLPSLKPSEPSLRGERGERPRKDDASEFSKYQRDRWF